MNVDRAKILILDDDQSHIRELTALLSAHYEVVSTDKGNHIDSIAGFEQPHLILMELKVNGFDGFQIIQSLKQNLETADIPVIVVTHSRQTRDETLSLRQGAVDYITKPYNPEIVKARVNTHVELKRHNELLRTLSYQDGLTGTANRRYFDETLMREHRRCKRNGAPLSLLMIDIDFFKAYNDLYGHLTGDDCLKLTVRTLQKQLNRAYDMLARYGGEEFICIFPETSRQGTETMAEKLRQCIRDMEIPHEQGIDGRVSISLGGITGYPHEGADPKRMLRQADQLLYQAKQSGRNQAVVADYTADEETGEGAIPPDSA